MSKTDTPLEFIGASLGDLSELPDESRAAESLERENEK
jgi:hypothetical protein